MSESVIKLFLPEQVLFHQLRETFVVIKFQIKEQKVLVDELSNLKKNRVSVFKYVTYEWELRK